VAEGLGKEVSIVVSILTVLWINPSLEGLRNCGTISSRPHSTDSICFRSVQLYRNSPNRSTRMLPMYAGLRQELEWS
jgi:hypothetical protein